jgi:hypothetical protein
MDGTGTLLWMVEQSVPVTGFCDSARPVGDWPLRPRVRPRKGGVHAILLAEILHTEQEHYGGFTQAEQEAQRRPVSLLAGLVA